MAGLAFLEHLLAFGQIRLGERLVTGERENTRRERRKKV
jgi:hypothetical protein